MKDKHVDLLKRYINYNVEICIELKFCVVPWNYNTREITCKKIPCYMRDSACRWFIVEDAKIFRSYVIYNRYIYVIVITVIISLYYKETN